MTLAHLMLSGNKNHTTDWGTAMTRHWSDLLFSFSGRISRLDFWYGHVIAVGLMGMIIVINVAIDVVFRLFSDDLRFPPVLGLLAVIVLWWAGLALSVKRLHDHEKSRWWLLMGGIPYLGALFLFVVLGCLRGTDGPNRFGSNGAV
jgi:uncharacterized membrane protein YhaH (DUF805 family)